VLKQTPSLSHALTLTPPAPNPSPPQPQARAFSAAAAPASGGAEIKLVSGGFAPAPARA
jgi:hypothetical protein